MRGFVISWYFPPINSSEGLVTFKLLKNSKYKYDVFTQKNNEAWSYGSNETKLVSSNINTIFSKTSDINEWINEGIEYFEQNKDKYDFIMSRSMAPESHMIALKIKQKYPEVKWIASFGDPLTDNPYNYFSETKSPYAAVPYGYDYISIKHVLNVKRILKNALWKHRKRSYEKNNDNKQKYDILQTETLELADRIILNNEFQKNYMLKEKSQEIIDKTIVFPHTYDVDFYDKNPNKNNKKIVFSYLGHLDCIRTPLNFLKALERLKEKNIDAYNKIEVNFYGNLADGDKLYIINNDLCDIVSVKKPVTYFESLKIMQESDWLLLIDANLGKYMNENIFFAAKIADYLGSMSNIFAITMDNGASADIMRETNSVLSSYSIDEIYMKLLMIINDKCPNKTINQEHYDIRKVVNKYDDMVKELK